MCRCKKSKKVDQLKQRQKQKLKALRRLEKQRRALKN